MSKTITNLDSDTKIEFDSSWKPSDGEWTITDGASNSQIKVDSDDSDQVTFVGSGGNIGPSYQINIGYSEEEMEELREIANDQIEKLQDLKDHLIHYISQNQLDRSETREWKSDFDFVNGHAESVRRFKDFEIENPYSMGISDKDELLDPDDMDEMNEIYKRWK